MMLVRNAMQTYLIVPDPGKKDSSKTYVKSSIRDAVSGAFAEYSTVMLPRSTTYVTKDSTG